MDIKRATVLLRQSSRTCKLQVHAIPKETIQSTSGKYNSDLSDRLYNFSISLTKEARSNWQRHADLCDSLLLFRKKDTDQICGFQMWKWGRSGHPGNIVLRGGKLRLASEVRGCGLHVLSNLVAMDSALTDAFKYTSQVCPVYRVGIVNVHAFASYFDALASFETWPFRISGSRLAEVCNPEIEAFLNDFGFKADRSGRIDVRQQSLVKPHDFTEAWWSKPGVSAFRQLHTEDRFLTKAETLDERSDVAIAWALDEANITSMRNYILRKLLLTQPG